MVSIKAMIVNWLPDLLNVEYTTQYKMEIDWLGQSPGCFLWVYVSYSL